jgi:hypothetical protein
MTTTRAEEIILELIQENNRLKESLEEAKSSTVKKLPDGTILVYVKTLFSKQATFKCKPTTTCNELGQFVQTTFGPFNRMIFKGTVITGDKTMEELGMTDLSDGNVVHVVLYH